MYESSQERDIEVMITNLICKEMLLINLYHFVTFLCIISKVVENF